MKPKRIKTSDFEARHPRELVPVKIVADAAISTRGRHAGKLLPLLLLDVSERPDVAEFFRTHKAMNEEGDVKGQWGKIEKEGHDGTVSLFLTFIRPVSFFMVLEFNIGKQGIWVEQTLDGQGLYIALAENAEDRYSKNVDRQSILVEVGDSGFKPIWDDLFQKHLRLRLRDMGLGRSEAKRIAIATIKDLQVFKKFKMPD
jgi:hypothetical protein